MLAKLICTDLGRLFVYDGLTNRIISICNDEIIYENDMKTVEKRIISDLYRQGILTDKMRGDAKWPMTFEEVRATLQDKIPRLVLQITRDCNLNCDYCIYSGNYTHMRSSAPESMSLETMFRSIDFYAAHSRGMESANVAFFGGEPLLRFPEIMKVTYYAKEVFKEQTLNISISTNGVLLSREIFQWMEQNPNVRIALTLNGPFHDRYRKDFSGKGSLTDIMSRLREMKSDYPDIWDKQIIFIANYTSYVEIPEILHFYCNELKISSQPVFLTGIRKDLGNRKIKRILRTNTYKERMAKLALRKEYYKHPDGLTSVLYNPFISLLDDRYICAPGDYGMRVESCMPFAVRLFVRTDGRFNVCERTSDAFVLGDLEHGFNEVAIERVMEEVTRLVNLNCKNCWAQRICLICFQHMVDENGKIRSKIPKDICRDMKMKLYELLQIYCEIY